MKALMFHRPYQMELVDAEEPALGPGELRVAVKYAGICGTDLRIYHGVKRVDGPRIIGHEFAGTISEAGSDVTGYKPGQRVVVYPIITCGTCYACAVGRTNICVHRRTFGYEIDGGFAENVTIPAAAVRNGNVIVVPDRVSDIAAAASEPVAAALHGTRRGGDIAGKAVVVMGGGPLGLAHVRLSRLLGAETVIMSEPEALRRQEALRLGADRAVVPAELADSVAGSGADIVFVAAGLPDLVHDAVGLLRKGGRCVIFAGMPIDSSITLDPNRIHYGEIDVVGSSGSTPELHAEVLEHAANGVLDLEALVSDVLPMADWERGFDMKQNAAGLKVLLEAGS
jgi:L-iditol 2-dehydrogenase